MCRKASSRPSRRSSFGCSSPGGRVILTTPRGEALADWTRLAGDPAQPVKERIGETKLRELFVNEKFNATGPSGYSTPRRGGM